MINCKSTPFFGDAEKLQQSRINTSQIQVVETSISFLFRVAQMLIFLDHLQHGQGGKANGGKFAPAKWLGDQRLPKESSASFFWGLSWTLESTQFVDFKRNPPLSISLSSFSGPIASSQGQNCICSANCGVIGCLNGA